MVFCEFLRRSNIEVVEFSSELEEKTMRLYLKVFGHKTYSPYIKALESRGKEIWAWKFPRKSSLRLVAVRNGEVIGHMGARIREFDVLGRFCLGAELVDGVVDSLFRNGAALYLMVQKMKSELQKRSVEFAFLFPNQFAERATLKRAAAVREAFLLEKILQVPEKHLHQGFPPKSWSGFPERAGAIYNCALAGKIIGTRRTPEYFQWRYVENPYEDYYPIILPDEKGYAILKIYSGEKAHIVDLVSEKRGALNELFEHAKETSIACGAKSISLYPLCEPWATWAREQGYQRRRWGRTLAVITATSRDPAVENIDQWYLTMSEHSIF